MIQCPFWWFLNKWKGHCSNYQAMLYMFIARHEMIAQTVQQFSRCVKSKNHPWSRAWSKVKENYLTSWADRHSTLFLQKLYLACIVSFLQWPHNTHSRLNLNYKKKSRICPRFVAEMTRRRIHYCWRFCVNEKKRWNEMDRLKLQGKNKIGWTMARVKIV